MEFKWIIFDIGRVLVELSENQSLARLSSYGHRAEPGLINKIGQTKTYDLYERGEMDCEQFFESCRDLLSLESLKRNEFEDTWNAFLGPAVSGIDQLLQKIKSRGLRIGTLSNTNPLHLDQLIKDYPLFQYFDDICASHHSGARKPEKEIYQFLQKKLGISFQEMIFFDDKTENIEAAKALGIDAYQVQESSEEIEKYLEGVGAL